MHIISEQGSERATNDSGKVITFDGRTHVTWQDVTRQGYYNRVRTFDHATGCWGEPITLSEGVDNHARAVLAIDPDGILHAVLGGHGTPVRSLLSMTSGRRASQCAPCACASAPISASYGFCRSTVARPSTRNLFWSQGGPTTVPPWRSPWGSMPSPPTVYPRSSGGGDYYGDSRSVADMLASGGFRTNNVILEGLTDAHST
jgi:hypothetical protein